MGERKTGRHPDEREQVTRGDGGVVDGGCAYPVVSQLLRIVRPSVGRERTLICDNLLVLLTTVL